MLRSIFTGILFCLKKTVAGFVTAVSSVVAWAKKLCSLAKTEATHAKNWVVAQAADAGRTAVAVAKEYTLRQMLSYLIGFVCCFLFNEAAGDLTWFSRMLSSAKDCYTLAVRELRGYLYRGLLKT